MVNKSMKNKYGIGINVPKSTMTNSAGGAAYDRPSDEKVLKMLLVGTSANTYYVGAEQNIDNALAAFNDPSVDTKFLAKAIVYARKEGFNREFPLLALAVLSVRDVESYKAISKQVIRNAHDWEMFVDLCKSGKIRKGVGRAIKNDMVRSLKEMPNYQALKYPTAVFDMINICRPNPREVPVAYYLKNGGQWRDAVSKLENSADIAPKLELFYKYEAAKDTIAGVNAGSINADAGYSQVADSIRTNRLPYEVMTSVIGKDTKCWAALYESAPYFNMVRNLNSFIKYDAITNDNVLEAAARIANREAVHKSDMYPFRFFQAYKSVTNTNGGMLSDASLGVVKHGLEKAIEFSLDNVPIIPGTTCVATDVSGSMSSKVNSDYTDISCAEVAGIFSAILKLRNPKSIMLPFDDSVRDDLIARMNVGKSVQEIASIFSPGGGTALAAPVARLIDTRTKVDTLIGITDNMQWIEASWGSRGQHGMFIDAFQTYRKLVNPKCRAYLITLQAAQGAPVPAEIESVDLIYGWSDQVLKYINTDFAAQVGKVKGMSLDNTETSYA